MKLALASLTVMLSWGVAIMAHGQATLSYNIALDQSQYGHLCQLLTAPYTGGAANTNMCGATAFTNSFVYLQNEFPSIYGQALVPNSNSVLGQSSQAALISTADLLASSSYIGLDANGGTPEGHVNGLANYIQSCTPNTTVFDNQINPSYTTVYGWSPPAASVAVPSWQFLYGALSTQSSVNIYLWGGVDHYLTVTGFHWTDYKQDGTIDASDGAGAQCRRSLDRSERDFSDMAEFAGRRH